MRGSGVKFDRDLVGLERSLGFRSNRGISRQSNKDYPPIQAIVQGMKDIAKEYVNYTTGEIRGSEPLRRAVDDLFDGYGAAVWPPRDQPQPAWLEDPSEDKHDGRYPRSLHYDNLEDRELLRRLFYDLVVEKCCNYHSNQLQRQRTMQRASLDNVESPADTPKKPEPTADSDSEMIDQDVAPYRQPVSFENQYDTHYTQSMKEPGAHSFSVLEQYSHPTTETEHSSMNITANSAAQPAGISWTPANMTRRDSAKDSERPTPSETAASDRPMRPKRKRPQHNEDDLAPKKVSGDRKTKKPRWSQIIPLKINSYHLERLERGERIAERIVTPEEAPLTPPEDTTMLDGDEDQGETTNAGSVASATMSPLAASSNGEKVEQIDKTEFSPSVEHTPRSPTEPDRRDDSEFTDAPEEANQSKRQSPQPIATNGHDTAKSSRAVSASAPSSRPTTGHREQDDPNHLLNAIEVQRPHRPSLPPQQMPQPEGIQHPSPSQQISQPQPPQQPTSPQEQVPQQPPAGPQKLPLEQEPRPEPAPERPTRPTSKGDFAPLIEPDASKGPPHQPTKPQWPSVIGLPGQPHAHPDSAPFPAAKFQTGAPPGWRPNPEPEAAAGAAHPHSHAHGHPNPAAEEWQKMSMQHQRREPPPFVASPAPQGHAHPAGPMSLAEEVLGEYIRFPTVGEMLRTRECSRQQLETMRAILAHSPEARTDFAIFNAHLYGRRENAAGPEQNGRSPWEFPSAMHLSNFRPLVPPQNNSIPPQPAFTLPSNADVAKRPVPPNPVTGSNAHRYAEFKAALGDALVGCSTVQKLLNSAREIPHKHLKSLKKILKEDPITQSNFEALYERLEALDKQPTPSTDSREQGPSAEIPRGHALHSPRQTPGHANPFNAFANSFSGRISQQGPPPPAPRVDREIAPAPRVSIVRSPPTADERKQDTPHASIESNMPRPAPHHPDPRHPMLSAPQTPTEAVHPPQRGPPSVGNAMHHNPAPPHGMYAAPLSGFGQPPMPHPVVPSQPAVAQPNPEVKRSESMQAELEQQQQKVAMPIRSNSIRSEQDQKTSPRIGSSLTPAPTPGAPQNSLEDVSIEINWARNLDYSDHLSMDDCLRCTTAADFFKLIEAQVPDELQGHPERIKEVRVKAQTPLQMQGVLPRITRAEGPGKTSLRRLVKIMRAQPPDAEIELEFLVVWE